MAYIEAVASGVDRNLGYGNQDSAEVTAMKRAGMTSEYFNSIDNAFRARFGKGMSGDMADRIKSDRNFADYVWNVITGKGDEEIKNVGSKDEAQVLSNLGLLNMEDWTRNQSSKSEKRTFETNLSDAVSKGYISKDVADGYRSYYAQDPTGANAALSGAIAKGIEALSIPKFQYEEPAYVTEAKKILQEQMNATPTFSTKMVQDWLPTLLEAQRGAKEADYRQIADQQNQMGRLFSGQTLRQSQDVGNRYSMDALNKALGFASQDYAQQIANKESAIAKNLAIGQYETGIKQYQNQQDVQEALNRLTQAFGTAETNRLTNQQNLSDQLSRLWANEDWNKQAELSRQLAAMQNSDSGFDWTKLLQPAATVGAAYLTGGTKVV